MSLSHLLSMENKPLFQSGQGGSPVVGENLGVSPDSVGMGLVGAVAGTGF